MDLISGIQQIGIGVKDAGEAFKWYNETFKMDVPVFDDEAEAKLMVPLTNGLIRKRRAILAVNMAGGGGAEIWESRSPLPIEPKINPVFGDLGIFASKIKCQRLDLLEMPGMKIHTLGSARYAWITDPYGNAIQLCEDDSWFKPSQSNTGGVLGAVIGVSDMSKSIELYKAILGDSVDVVFDQKGTFEDLSFFNRGESSFHRVILKKKEGNEGAFVRLFGNIEIELVQDLDRKPRVIFEGRSWGDLGYIHLCFDTLEMEMLGQKLGIKGYPFVVDSANSFDMGDAAGRFTYIVDPDGTLIEFVETHKVPILKKLNWYINLQKRGNRKRLPNWMINTLGWGRVKV